MDNRNSFFGNIPAATKNIIIINTLLFLATQFVRAFNWDILGMYYWQTNDFKLFQIITYMFMHANLSHIFFNMFAVFMFGGVLERFWGAKKFLLYYFVTGIGAALAQQLVWYLSGNFAGVTVGASGAVFGLLLAYGMMFPNEKIYLYFAIPIKAKYFIIIYGLLELFLGVANFSNDNVAHFAHLGGLVFGIILMLYWRKKGGYYNERI